jgi:hypothetical protein
MKFLYTLFAMAVIAFSPVHAADHEVLVAKNDAGGIIMLTSYDCPIDAMKGSKISVIVQSDFQVYGCWFVMDQIVYVAWFYEGRVHKVEYDPGIFVREKVL